MIQLFLEVFFSLSSIFFSLFHLFFHLFFLRPLRRKNELHSTPALAALY